MKLAIVGSSRLTSSEEKNARESCEILLKQMVRNFGRNELILVSGGASGVDTIAETTAYGLGLKCDIHRPTSENWDGYKARNLKIAQECDVIYCFPTKVRLTPCYHCGTQDHERSGGCWTVKHAKTLKKEGHVVPLI